VLQQWLAVRVPSQNQYALSLFFFLFLPAAVALCATDGHWLQLQLLSASLHCGMVAAVPQPALCQTWDRITLLDQFVGRIQCKLAAQSMLLVLLRCICSAASAVQVVACILAWAVVPVLLLALLQSWWLSLIQPFST
jgi:hypothetical protein